ncbi:MAG: hypothetical protein ABEJ83_04445 [Candidatus Nanohaloarchaea archaeon]
MVSVVQVGPSQYVVTVPQELRKAKGWEKGQELQWCFNDDGKLTLEERYYRRWKLHGRKDVGYN